MEKNKHLMMKMLGVGLCVALSWGVSPSMAGSPLQTEKQYKTNMLRSFKTPAMKRYSQPTTKTNLVAPNLNKSLTAKPFNAVNSKVTTKNPLIFKQINPGQAVHLNSQLLLKKDPVGIQKNVQQSIGLNSQAGSGGWGGGYGKAPSDPNFGGYGGNGGNGVLPAGPTRVPGSTPPPPQQQGKTALGNPVLDCLLAGGSLDCFGR